MKLLSWNIRGCNNPLKKQLLKRKIQLENPAILFRQETKCSSEDMESLCKRIWKGAKIVVNDAAGAVAGISMLWNPNLVSITNTCATRYLISAWFHILRTEVRGVVSNAYGPFKKKQKGSFLEDIHNTKDWIGHEH